MKKIVTKENPVLRRTSSDVDPKTISGPEIQNLIEEMHESLASCPDGVALAAPQIGVNKRVFVISPKAWGENYSEEENLVYINPTIIKRSRKKNKLDEGCLSVPGAFGDIKRHEKTTVSAYNEHGKKFTRGGSELLAEIFQHEIDHLDGILFIDKATNIREIKHSGSSPRSWQERQVPEDNE